MGDRDLSLYIGRTGVGAQIASAGGDLEVVVKETTAAGVAYLTDAETAPDSIVTDHDPPDLDCFELLEAVPPELPVILAPSDGSSRLATQALAAGTATYLDPTTVDDGAAAIVAAIERVTHSRQRAVDTANSRIERFASIVSHELRSPIQTAKSGIDLAKADCDSKYLDKVEDTLDQMDALTRNLLDELEDGETTVETEPVDLSTLVRGAWPEPTTATLSVESDLPTVEADPSRLRQLLSNLFRNSVQHGSTRSRKTPDDDASETVTVRIGVIDAVADDGDSVGIYIADDGPGIEPDRREDIFEYGYTQSEDGTGFGLAIVSDIVETLNWEIDVTDSPSGGAQFELTQMKKV